MFKNNEKNIAIKEEKSTKKRSKIIIDILNNNISVSDALYKLKVLLSDLDNKTVIEWIDEELTGYKTDNIPEYRKFTGAVIGNLMQGYTVFNEINIPIKNDYKNILNRCIKEDITTVEKYASDDKNSLAISLDFATINQIAGFELNEVSQITHAKIIIPASTFTEIISNVKKVILDVLINLEKKYGNLDEYYIEFNSKKEKDEVAKTIINIIKIGDKNKIANSSVGVANEN